MSNIYIISAVLLISLAFTKLLVGFEKNRNRYKKDAVMSIFIYVMSYYIIIYLAGIFTGFLKSPYSLSITNIFLNTFPFILLIVSSEIFRYAINRKVEKTNLQVILSTCIFVLIDISIVLYGYDIHVPNDILELVTLIIMPSISKNILLTYTSIKFGYSPNIMYRVLTTIPLFLVPIIPNFGEYLDAVIEFLLPAIIFALMYISYNKFERKKNKVKTLEKSRFNKGLTLVSIIIILIIIYLTSGYFKYFALSIGSGSMESTIYKGDIVIVEKVDELEELEIGEILVFKIENTIIVHRIEDIINENNSYSFITKGDNNENTDNWVVTEPQVIGKVGLKIKYIGYPTVWLNEQMN